MRKKNKNYSVNVSHVRRYAINSFNWWKYNRAFSLCRILTWQFVSDFYAILTLAKCSLSAAYLHVLHSSIICTEPCARTNTHTIALVKSICMLVFSVHVRWNCVRLLCILLYTMIDPSVKKSSIDSENMKINHKYSAFGTLFFSEFRRYINVALIHKNSSANKLYDSTN